MRRLQPWPGVTCFCFAGGAVAISLVALGSALRATGIIKPTVVLQVLSVVLNIVLAPLG
jgi:Na+-driven multidrug efflux pump